MKIIPVLVLTTVGLGLFTGCQTAPGSLNRGSSGQASQVGTGQNSEAGYEWNGWDKPIPGPNPLGYPDSPNYRWIR